MDLSRKFDGKKFMWDGNEYQTKEEAEQKAREYSERGFEVRMIEENGKFYVFTRKVITEIEVEGAPPI